MEPFLLFLGQAVLISLTGVMAPGPVTVATLAAGTRNRHAGAWIALGHALVEFPLMLLILLGIGRLLEVRGVQAAIGLAGGAFLAMMGVGILRDLRKPPAQEQTASARHPFWTGVALTGGNPYFLLWWATVGLALAATAAQYGALAFAIFSLLHWLCDLVWLELLSLAIFKGATLLKGKALKITLGLCGGALLLFAAKFLLEGLAKLR